MVTANLDGFSLANCRQFAKSAKFSTCQTFPLYGIQIKANNWLTIEETWLWNLS